MATTMKVLILIPARGGSKGIPRKNLMQVGGLTLVARAVLTARQFVRGADLRDAVVFVDTDDPEIAAEGERWGASVPFLRPRELATDTTPTSANVRVAIERLAHEMGAIDAVVLLQPTSPLRTVADVEACWRLFDPPVAPSVVSVSAYNHPVEYALRRAEDGTVSWASGTPPPSGRRQDFEPFYATNGAVYVGTVERFVSGRVIVSEVTRTVVMAPDRSVDVDGPEELRLAQAAAPRMPVLPVRVGRCQVGGGHPCLLVVDAAGVSVVGESDGRRVADAAVTAGANAMRLAAPAAARDRNGAGGWYRALVRHAADVGLAVIVEAHQGIEVARVVDTDVAAFAVPAAALSDHGLRAALAGSGRPVLCTVPDRELGPVAETLEALRAEGAEEVVVMSDSATPTAVTTARFALRRAAGWWSEGSVELAVVALAAGADVLGVPVPVSAHDGRVDRDAQERLRRTLRAVRRAEAAMGPIASEPVTQPAIVGAHA